MVLPPLRILGMLYIGDTIVDGRMFGCEHGEDGCLMRNAEYEGCWMVVKEDME